MGQAALPEIQNKTLSDRQVITRILDGEKELFEILLRRNNQILFRVIRSYIKEEGLAEDIMQDTYIKSYEKLATFNAESSFVTWLIRIGINECLQHLRKNKRNPIDNYSEDEFKIIQLPDTSYIEPDHQYHQNELKLLVEKAIDQLSEKYKVVFVLSELEGMSTEDISACLNLSQSNTKVRLHRSKKMLKEELYKMADGISIFEFGNSRCDRIVENIMSKI